MLKISAVFVATVVCAAFLASSSPSLGVMDIVSGADVAVVRVRTVAIRPSVVRTELMTFVASGKFHPTPNFRRNSTRLAALD